MKSVTLPFAPRPNHESGENPEQCPLSRMLPGELQEEVKDQPHLWEYIHSLPVEEVGIPQYFAKLTRAMGTMKNPNLIYPVGNGIYVHIYPDPVDARDYYIAIEPGMMEDLTPIMDHVERELVDLVNDFQDAQAGSRTQMLLGALDKIVHVSDEAKRKNGAGSKWWPFAPKARNHRLVLSPLEMAALRYVIIRDKEGLGALQPLISDPYIEDISCSGVGPVYIEHKIFKGLKASVTFDTQAALDSYVIRLSEKIGKPVTFRDPIVDATLPDGSRINIVFGHDVSKRGSNFTIRKFATTPMSILQLVEFGTLSYEIAAYLSLAVSHGMNIFVSGETASGKTTLLNAMTTFIPPTAKIVTIEDTPELQTPHPNWIQETVRGTGNGASGTSITMFQLLKAALRQRPNEIIIGEIRGEEGAIAFQAMQTGHACMATFHAASVEKLIQRLTGNPINVPKTYVDNLNVVVIQSMVRLPNGRDGRRVMSINEIVGYDSSSDSFSFVEVFRWNPATDQFEFTGRMNSYLLEQQIAMRRGIPVNQKRKIYDELERRTKILQRIYEQGVTDFYELFKILAKAHREGIFR